MNAKLAGNLCWKLGTLAAFLDIMVFVRQYKGLGILEAFTVGMSNGS